MVSRDCSAELESRDSGLAQSVSAYGKAVRQGNDIAKYGFKLPLFGPEKDGSPTQNYSIL